MIDNSKLSEIISKMFNTDVKLNKNIYGDCEVALLFKGDVYNLSEPDFYANEILNSPFGKYLTKKITKEIENKIVNEIFLNTTGRNRKE